MEHPAAKAMANAARTLAEYYRALLEAARRNRSATDGIGLATSTPEARACRHAVSGLYSIVGAGLTDLLSLPPAEPSAEMREQIFRWLAGDAKHSGVDASIERLATDAENTANALEGP